MARANVIQKYRDKGLKLTPQRIAILDFLDGNTDHPSAEEIFSGIKQTNPTISFATVYNTIQALRERGELVEVTIDPERKHYDPNPEPHHHLICSKCGKIGDVFEDFTDALKLPQELLGKFSVTSNHVNFYGACINCSKGN